MNRYLLKFYKQGNMRFLSHLDLARLFKRAIRKGTINISYSNGFNPHELLYIIQPLSLGFESVSEYCEIQTETQYDTNDLMTRLNSALPQGVEFIECKEISQSNVSGAVKYASYHVIYPYSNEDILKIKDDSFANRDTLIVLKHDKKTKKYVEKDVKEKVHSFKFDHLNRCFDLIVDCGTNSTLNPANLIAAFNKYYDIEFDQSLLRVTREAFYIEDGEQLKSPYEVF